MWTQLKGYSHFNLDLMQKTFPTLDVTESLQPFTHLVYETEQYSQVQSILSLKTKTA